MANFDLTQYETVEDRLKRFYKDHTTGRVITELVSDDGSRVVFKAYLYKAFEDTIPVSTGYAEETKGDGYVNKTSHMENCETSAIGRALANYNYQGSKRPSREEMQKVQRLSTQEQKSVETTKPALPEKPVQVEKKPDTAWKATPISTKQKELVVKIAAMKASDTGKPLTDDQKADLYSKLSTWTSGQASDYIGNSGMYAKK